MILQLVYLLVDAMTGNLASNTDRKALLGRRRFELRMHVKGMR
jgi:hypothetical protein